jgi:dipeptide/tripeptide permease
MKFFYKKQLNLKTSHWLDYGEEKYGQNMVNDAKSTLKILAIFTTFPVFWSLLCQQFSTWVFQALRMNSDLGLFTVKTDHVVLLGPFFIAFLVPIFNKIFIPLMTKIGIKSPLQRIFCGMICAGSSFIVAAFLEIEISKNYITIVWLFPQYFLVAMAETLLWVATMTFVYSESSQNMKSTLTAFLYLTIASGSLIVFFISSLRLFNSQVMEFVFYACLMFLNTLYFAFLAKFFKSSSSISTV